MTITRIVLAAALVAGIVAAPVALAAPALACGTTPGLCPNPPGAVYPDTGDVNREGYPAWHTASDWG